MDGFIALSIPQEGGRGVGERPDQKREVLQLQGTNFRRYCVAALYVFE